MRWESPPIVLAGAATAEGEGREADSDGSGSAGVVCCHESPLDPFRRRRPAAAAAAFFGGVVVVVGNWSWKMMQTVGMATGARHC
jgi:hypothetical protein